MSKICPTCKKVYTKYPASLEAQSIYCSRKCVANSKTRAELIRKANLGKKRQPWSNEVKRKIGASQMGEKNHRWVGDKVAYGGLHSWIKTRLKKPEACQDCGENKPLDLANISQEYKRDLNDWEWLCRSCHMKKDGRINKLSHFKKGQVARNKTEDIAKKCIVCGSKFTVIGRRGYRDKKTCSMPCQHIARLRTINTRCPQGISCTVCKAEDYKRKARIQELLTYMETHKHLYLDDYCICESVAQELSMLGYKFKEPKPVDDIPF